MRQSLAEEGHKVQESVELAELAELGAFNPLKPQSTPYYPKEVLS
jgi:hypothetical protein